MILPGDRSVYALDINMINTLCSWYLWISKNKELVSKSQGIDNQSVITRDWCGYICSHGGHTLLVSLVFCCFFCKSLEDLGPFRGATDTPILDFW